MTNFIEKASRLYEQERKACRRRGPSLETYVRRWIWWVAGGLTTYVRGSLLH